MLQLLKFDRVVQDADWVITGEGCSDFQTAHGKLCSVVAAHSHRFNVPVILLSGALGLRAEELEESFDAVLALASGPVPLQTALQQTEKNLCRMGKAIMQMIKR